MDSFWVMIIPGLISVWNMIIFRTFFQQLPKGLEDSAKIDGCGYWGTFFRIILPLSGPVIATLSLFTAVGHWNDWFMPSIYITSDHLIPLQTFLQEEGLITLKDGVGVNGTLKDVTENPKNFEWLSVDLLNLAEAYDEPNVSLVYNYPTYIAKIGLKPADALFLEKTIDDQRKRV